MFVINLNLKEVLNAESCELILENSDKTESSLLYDEKIVQKNRIILKTFFKTDFIKSLYKEHKNTSKLFYINKNIESVLVDAEDTSKEYLDVNLKDSKNGNVYFRDVIQDGQDSYYYQFRPVKIVKSLVPFYRDNTVKVLLLDEESLLCNYSFESLLSSDSFEKLSEACDEAEGIKILKFMKKYRYVTCLYEISVEKLNKNTFDYEIENRTLKTRVLNDVELIKLLKNENLAVSISKSKKKREKLKNREIRKNNDSRANAADNASDASDGVTDDKNESIEILEIPPNMPFPSYNSDNEIHPNYEDKPNIKFVSIDYFTYKDRIYIRSLLNDLYEKNEKYKTYISNNSFSLIMVLKTFHYDKSFIDESLHFNILFKNSYTKSSVKHVYIKDEAINSITEINNILD
jgi:hypothetical protein